jgi:AraC family transcriptional regulator of adaptative response/methylated-DNA-[protein]-cysteine methyltransferase
MTKISVSAAPQGADNGAHDIGYGYGRSSLGDFLVAIDEEGLCAVLFGDDRASLLEDLRSSFPSRKLARCDRSHCCDFIVNAVACLIEQPAGSIAFPTSIGGGDFKQMVHAALRHTRPGMTITPEELAVMIGAASASAPYVRACVAADLLAVAVPFHRLQEPDGTNPDYRWGEKRRQALLKREAAIWSI